MISFAAAAGQNLGETHTMSITTILIVILIIALVGGLPNWQYSQGWGYGPSSVFGVLLVVLLVLVLMGRV